MKLAEVFRGSIPPIKEKFKITMLSGDERRTFNVYQSKREALAALDQQIKHNPAAKLTTKGID